MAAAASALPVRRLTLYKHGVGLIERGGALEGDEAVLSLRSDALNDTLKSLLVVDGGGGQVLGLEYTTPRDRDIELQRYPLGDGDNHSLIDLLRGLRGWSVRLTTSQDGVATVQSGRVLGVEMLRPSLAGTYAVLRDAEANAVFYLPLQQLARIELLDERPSRDLQSFLDLIRAEETHCEVRIRLSPGAHDLEVSYLVPCPTWRVSYRLVVEAMDAADAGGQTSQLLLLGWGLFDNSLDEDLSDVSVTLTAGQPVSFIYDLAASRVPARTVVEDAAHIAAGPVEFDQALAAAPAQAAPMPVAAKMASPAVAGGPAGGMARDMLDVPARLRRARESLAQQEVVAAGSDLGEMFQYVVTTPVTVRRGDSALVPILNAPLRGRRELLFNQGKLPGHPVAALRFTNSTGLTLERGPVTVYVADAYSGEAVVPFVKEGGEVYVAYAVELGIRVSVETATTSEGAGIRITGALLEEKQALVMRTTYRLENTLADERSVTIEHPIWPNSELAGTPDPEARTAEYYRWSVPCLPRRATTFAVAERRYTWQSSALLDRSYEALREFLRRRWLDGPTLARIEGLLREREAIARNDERIARLQAERTELYEREEQVRKNMTALSAGGDEGRLRARAVSQLAACEDRLEAIEGEIKSLQQDSAGRRTSLDQQLAALRVDTS